MITPRDIHKADTNVFGIKMAQFCHELSKAETTALENYTKLRSTGSSVNHIRIKLDGDFPESMIKAAVDDYIRAGWENVHFNQVNLCPGSREPMMQWVITIKTDEHEEQNNHNWTGKCWKFEITIPKPDCKDNKKMENLHTAMGELGYMLDEILVGAGYEKRIYKNR